MKFSIVFVNYNDWHFLKPCINSIKAVAYKFEYEIIVVDNASNGDEASKIKEAFPDVLVIEPGENLGFAGGNNIGMQQASGEYLLLLNADTVFLDSNLNEAIVYMDEHSEVGILGPKLVNKDLSWQRSAQTRSSVRYRFWRYLLSVLSIERFMPGCECIENADAKVEFILGAAMLIRKRTIDDIGLFDTRFFFAAEEWDLCLRATNGRWLLVYYPGWKVLHYGGASGHSTLWYLYQWHNSTLSLYKKYWGRAGYLVMKFAFVIGTLSNIMKCIVNSAITLKQSPDLRNHICLLKWHCGLMVGGSIKRN